MMTNKMKEWFTNIINYIKENKVLLIIIAVLILIAIILFLCCKNLKNKNKILENNFDTAIEQVDSLELANGQLLYERQSYVLSLAECERVLSCSRAELKDMQKKLDSKLLYISELEGQIAIPHIEHDTTFIYRLPADSLCTFTAAWKEEPWWRVNSTLALSDGQLKASLSDLNVNVPLTVGLTEDWKIFATSPNPYVHFTSIEGAVLDKDVYLRQQKKPKWSLGVSGGYYFGYNLIDKKFYTGPGIGFSISYNFLTW